MSDSNINSPTTWKLPDASVPGNVIIFVTSLLGTILNFHLLCAYYRNKNRLTVNQYPLVNMTVGDFGLAASCTLVFALHLMYRDIDMTWCQVNGFTNVFFAGQSVLSCALLAVERYFLIVHYHSITRRQVFLFSLGIWFSSTAVALIPIIFKTNNYPKISGIYCLSDNTSQFVFNRVYAIGCLTILLTGMIFLSLSYLLLYKKATKIGFKWVSVENLKAAAETDIECTKNEAKIAQMEFTKKLVLIIITFCVCWVPHTIVFFHELITGTPMNPWFDGLAAVAGVANSVVNAVIIMNMDTRWKVNFPRTLGGSLKGWRESVGASLEKLMS